MELKDLARQFEKVAALLESKAWFSKGEWLHSQHPFPKVNPGGLTFHVYKKNWFNDDKLGIHFESFLELNSKRHLKTYITLHTLHYDKFPKSEISRREFSKPLVDSIFAEVGAWEGYKFRTGKYGLQPFTKYMNAASPTFTEDLATEFERLCQRVGPKIDATLQRMM